MYRYLDSIHDIIQMEGNTVDDSNVIFLDMPATVKSFVRANPDNSFTIVINSRLSAESQRERYRHEIQHIRNGDFWREDAADVIEKERH